jgi:hypothetical protein
METITFKLLPSGRYICYGEHARVVAELIGEPRDCLAPVVIERATQFCNTIQSLIRKGYQIAIVGYGS